MYSRQRPDSQRFMGGRSHVFCFEFKSLGTWLFSATVKVVGTVAYQWMDLIINIQRSRTPFVFEKCLIPLQSVLNTNSDDGIHYVSICRTFVFVSHCILPDRCTAEANAQMHDHCQSTCRLFFIQCFFSIFSLDATLKTVGGHLVSIWAPPRLLYHNWYLIRSRTPIRSRFGHHPRYYTTIDFWSGLAHPSDAKSSVISQMSLSQYHMSGVYNILSQVGRFAFKHIRLMSCLMSLQSCCPHDECIHSFRVACV